MGFDQGLGCLGNAFLPTDSSPFDDAWVSSRTTLSLTWKIIGERGLKTITDGGVGEWCRRVTDDRRPGDRCFRGSDRAGDSRPRTRRLRCWRWEVNGQSLSRDPWRLAGARDRGPLRGD
jgi:hypothetical protein